LDGCRFRFRRFQPIDQQRKGFVLRERKAWHTAPVFDLFALAFGRGWHRTGLMSLRSCVQPEAAFRGRWVR
jgi:hypothetical protein